MIGMCSSDGRVGEQERAEEDKVQIVRRLEKVMKNKSSMLFALSSLLMQQSEAVNLPLAAAQGNMSFLEIVVAILMIALTIYFVVNLERYKELESALNDREKAVAAQEKEVGTWLASLTKKEKEVAKTQKLDDLEYEYKEIKGDMIYFKDYADEVDKAMLNAKEKIRRQRKKIKELKKTM
ncbi:unnamed protein product, partial [Symbiodinium necroappetens]